MPGEARREASAGVRRSLNPDPAPVTIATLFASLMRFSKSRRSYSGGSSRTVASLAPSWGRAAAQNEGADLRGRTRNRGTASHCAALRPDFARRFAGDREVDGLVPQPPHLGIGNAVIANFARLTEQRSNIIAIRRTDVRIEESDERVVHAR